MAPLALNVLVKKGALIGDTLDYGLLVQKRKRPSDVVCYLKILASIFREVVRGSERRISVG